MKTGLWYVRGDRLVAVFRDRESSRIYKQGKRVGRNCPLTREAKDLLDAAR